MPNFGGFQIEFRFIADAFDTRGRCASRHAQWAAATTQR
jgi:hypothetical protein